MTVRFFAVLIVAGLLAFPVSVYAQQESHETYSKPAFFLKLEDIPLMPGLVELESEAIIFDKPGGRIAESAAETNSVSAEDISRFYTKTLPHLGWQQVDQNLFVRNGEVLEIDVTNEELVRHVQVTVTPKP